MVKRELIEDLAKILAGITKQDMTDVVDTLFESMALALMRGEAVEVRGLGRFTVRERAARKARNPKTGTSVDLPTHWVVHFKPAESLTKRLNLH